MITKTAKIKLTTWYLIIISIISILFSVLVYRSVTFTTRRALDIQKSRMERRHLIQPELPRRSVVFEEETLKDIQNNVKFFLIRLNLGIMALSSVLGYLLAGRTLKPIEEMIEDQKRFISNSAHELKTPITALKTELEVTLKDNKLSHQDAIKVLISNLEEVNKLQNLAESLLKESNYQKDKITLRLEKVNLKSIIEEVTKSLAPEMRKSKLTLKLNLRDIYVKGEVTSLKEMVTILIDNAIKYSPKNKSINVSLDEKHKKAVLTVKDHGIGIRKSDLPYIFNRFYRADNSHSNNQTNGFGLGLSIARNIANFHHGTIEVESEINKGSTFTVKLPLA